MQLDQRGEAKTQPVGVGLRKCIAQELVKKELRFKIGTSGGEFDFAHAVTQVQPLALFMGWPEKTHQPASEIRRLADVRLAFASEQENRCRSREFLKEALVLIRRESERAHEHKDIVVAVRRSSGDSPIARFDIPFRYL